MERKKNVLKHTLLLFHEDQKWPTSQKQLLMKNLVCLFLEPKFTTDVCVICRTVILDIVIRASENLSTGADHDKFYTALSKGILLCPDLKSYAANYLREQKSELPLLDGGENRTQKEITEISKATWIYVTELGDSIRNVLSVDIILNFLSQNQQNKEATWYLTNAAAEMLSMSSSQRQEFIGNFLPDKEDLSKFRIRHLSDREQTKDKELSSKLGQVNTQIQDALSRFVESDFHQNVAMVAGVMLQKAYAAENQTETCGLIPVESTVSHLRSLALAVASGNPVLLQGPVGCGKTSLIEHLGQVTGRQTSPSLMKIQLGDQTDSKALLGTYRCTDIPGEFLWQPGILTQAVTDGHWVVLEDIDSAPMDVVSVLLPLLERNSLSLPGHGDNVHTSPNFRLFATQRLLGSHSGWHRQHNNSSVLLEKMWTKINVQPLSRAELEQVITTKYPALKPVVDRLLDIYFMLSAGKHDNTGSDEESVGKFLSHDGRLISTRDLMTWCKRIATDFDISSSATGNLVIQEALDCFVSCLSSTEKRILVAEAIGAKLNVNKVKSEFYCCKYKPEVQISQNKYTVGRAVLPRVVTDIKVNRAFATFSFTRQSSALLEKVAVCVMNSEPVLLVGETGTGKTSSVQYLAQQLGHTLKVVNMNQQSDSSDLLGGFKPVDMKHVVKPFHEDFEILFCQTFSRKENIKFIGHLQDCFIKKKWNMLFKLMEHTMKPAFKKMEDGKLSEDLTNRWRNIKHRLQQLTVQVQQTENVLAFSFIEGTLVKALRNGDWILLDEINLAAAETLECLSGLLESQAGSLVLTERVDLEPVVRDENFRLFACMNPATDVGKKDLPIGIRNRFTEFYVDELEEVQDLKILVGDYLRGIAPTSSQVEGIVKFYLTVREEAVKKLTDGTGHRPHFSLRTLCRALRYASSNPCGQVARSLYEGFCLSFLTQLDRSSHPVVENLICKHILGKFNIKSILKQPIPMPTKGKWLNFEGYWISVGKDKPMVPDHYILTPSVRQNLKDLCRVISGGQHPVLLQGETSVGKTSLVTYLAKSTGNHCVRVNNHEHTDLQEYVGCYSADENGKLVFKEGVLVEAMRKGHWIILDELNLAPTDVLEALNRLLDDNRELFIPETQETIKAHSKFMLFATQNPPGHYGGRKMLSRAFRNRFIELHFDVIPSGELETILHERCDIPMSYSKKLVAVMLDLQTRRRGSGVFAGKQGFMTLRDLFRWAERYKCKTASQQKFYDWEQHMADHGYMVLAGRVRKQEESLVVSEVIQKHFKRTVDPDRLFTLNADTSTTTKDLLKSVMTESSSDFRHVVWTYSMRRLAVLIGQAILFKEPVLLVGETGCGKTTMCQMLAALKKINLYSINCHLHTESADFLGGLRPCRTHDQDGPQKLFEWVDGPLITAMKEGAMFLIDEISLADDSVLERLNSVLEPEQMILLAEKGGGDGSSNEVEHVQARDGFQVFSTMNPGGDFGKKELSPALRNRFTEIWCPQTDQRQDFINIIEHNIKSGIHLCNMEDGTSGIGKAIIDFIEWFSNNDYGKRCTVSIRDILSWVNFINTTAKTLHDGDIKDYNKLDPPLAFIHGACLVFLDGLGSGTTSRGSDSDIEQTRTLAMQYLLKQVSHMTHQSMDQQALGLVDKHGSVTMETVKIMEDKFCIWPFSIDKGLDRDASKDNYALQAPTTCVNAQRILRGLQLPRPLLLEGSPGIGKTSLVSAIAKACGRHLVRINLSEQTDVTDLFGADLPVEGAEGGVFAWRDGPLLQALKAGHWVVLDELNLASQSVLEGLNACLDHRAEVYIPELSKTFHIQHEKTRLFACQNPLNQGGGRKGLPRSFLNRFTQVYVEPLTSEDLMFITSTMYPSIPQKILKTMVEFNLQMNKETVVERKWGQKGSPWEFNLRDVFRWCQLIMSNQSPDELNPGEYVSLLYRDRMRTVKDKQMVLNLYRDVFPEQFPAYISTKHFWVTSTEVQCGHSFLPRMQQILTNQKTVLMLHHCMEPLESVMKCVEMNWLSIVIGPQSSGKTSLIQLLASLCGQDLQVLAMNSSMDTTELLGGFEQSDPARHIEELGNAIHLILNQIQRCLLKKGDLNHTVKITKSWNKFIEASKHCENMSSVEELEQMRKRVKCLAKVLKMCTETVQRYVDLISLNVDCSSLSEKLEILSQKLTDSKTGSGGGTFEWVDSILVTALQSGQWLLIDNVNFCSPSVLDRLNALLEPNGELTINERGVIDGKIPSIKPHPNFRLFLAMDPKFGEISRAMRNRGVEVYIPGEDDGAPYSDVDVRTMLHSLGLVWNKACDWLMSFHDLLRSQLPRGEQPNILDLLCVATTTKQQIDRGVPLDKALSFSTNDIYVKNVKYLKTKQLAKSIWTTKCEELMDQDLMCDVMVQLIPSVSSYSNDTMVARVQQNGCSILHYCKEITDHVERGEMDISTKLMELKYTYRIFLNNLPIEHRDLYSEWLRSIRSDVVREVQDFSTEITGRFVTTVNHSNIFVNDAGTRMIQADIINEIKDRIEKLIPDSTVKELPLDLRWNQQMLDRLKHKYNLNDEQTAELQLMLNKYYLLESMAYSNVLDRQNNVDIWNALHEIAKKPKIDELMLLSDVSRVFGRWNDFLQMMMSLNLQSFADVTKALEAYSWISLLIDIVLKVIKKTSDIHKLTLYWNWFYDRFVTMVSDLMPSELSSIVKHVHSNLGQNNDLGKKYVKFWRSFGHPAPCRTLDESQVIVCLLDIAKQINVHQPFVRLMTLPKVRVHVNEGQAVIDLLLSCLMDLRSDDYIEKLNSIESKIADIKRILLKYGIKSNVSTGSTKELVYPSQSDLIPIESDQSDERFPDVDLWPLHETIMAVVGRQLMYKEGPRQEIETYADYCLHFTPTSPWFIDVLRQTMDHKDKQQELHPLLRLMFYKSLWNMTSAQCFNQWLNLSTEQETVDSSVGPAFLFTPTISYISAHYLTNQTRHEIGQKTENQLQPLLVPLGSFTAEINKLDQMTTQLWCHGGVLSSKQLEARHAEKMSLHQDFGIFIKAVLNLFPDENSSMNDFMDAYSHAFEERDYLPTLDHALEVFMTPLYKVCKENALVTNCIMSMAKALGGNYSPLGTKLTEEEPSLSCLGTAWVWFGMLCVEMLTPYLAVDPVEKVAIKLEILQNMLSEIEYELSARDTHHQIQTGDSLYSVPDHLLHPHVVYLKDQRIVLQDKIQLLKQQQAYRPTPSQFRQLVSLITNFKSSIGSISHVTNLLKKFEQMTVTKATKTFGEEEAWQKSMTSFVTNLEENFPLYRDITVPFLVAVYQIKHGIRLICTEAKQKNYQQELIKDLKTKDVSILSNTIVQLSRFPSVCLSCYDFLSLADHINSTSSQSVVAKVIPEQAHAMISSLRNSGLDLIYCDGFIRKELTPQLIFLLSQILNQFVAAWQQQEERRKQKEEEDACLYRYKSQVHGDERKEEQREEDEFRQNFSSFEQEFIDVTGQQSLESTPMEESKPESDAEIENAVSEQEMNFVCRIHKAVFTLLTHSDWLKQSHDIQVKVQDIVKPVLSNYYVMTSVLRATYPYLSESIDTDLFGGHLLVASYIKQQVTQQDEQTKREDYDVYHDSNVPEVIKCLPVMARLVVRVNQLQEEWPDHPTLKQVLMIVDRIKSFAITSRVIKYLTGLELLLEKAQDWESNAAKHVSMMTELSEITAVIIEWRKLELSCWSTCLDTVYRRQTQQASKWWFFVYQLLNSYIQDQSDQEDSEVPPVTEADVLKSLEEFIEKSTLGEFTSRLDMLKSFHCQLVHMEASDKQKYLLNLLWNLYKFYSQFTRMVEDQIKSLRAPIEKELKGFVKIARWTDMNYWALKQTTEKTHRTLHKHMKSFQAALTQPVRGILQETTTAVSPESVSTWREQYINTHLRMAKQDKVTQIQMPHLECPLINRSQTLCSKMYKHWTGLSDKLQYTCMVEEMDSFIGDMIEEVHELQSKEVNQSLEKEKRLSEAKHICQLRRRALADLFKHLTASGLSYRKGLTRVNDPEISSLPLKVDPVDFKVLMEQCKQSRFTDLICNTWEGCQEYYFKCISRKAKLASALMSPSQELGVGNIDRCRGFTEHLMSLVVQQYTGLSTIGQHYKSVRSMIEALTPVIKDKEGQMCQEEAQKWHVDFKSLLTSVIEGLMQFQALLQACPKPLGRETIHPSPITADKLSPMALVKQGEEIWNKCVIAIQNLIQKSVDIQKNLLNENGTTIWSRQSVKTLMLTAEKLESFLPELKETVSLFDTQGYQSKSPFTATLTYLHEEIDDSVLNFQQWLRKEERKIHCFLGTEETILNEDVQSFGYVAEELISSVLLVMQGLKKNHEADAVKANDDDGLQEPVKFVQDVIQKLKEDTVRVLSTRVSNHIQQLIKDLVTLWNSPDTGTVRSSLYCCRIMSQCMPLLHQYCDIVEYYLVQNLAANRTSAKLLSVLLGIFTELASKGFCTPEEFSDEMSGEGATEFEDIENAGMGEGQGVKDVSDQIENEDQLDEARKAGEKPEETSDQPDIPSEDNAIEMSEDMDGKLHDMEPQEGEGEEDDEGKEEEEIDKQMGDVDEEETDKLDEQMWGSDEETEEQNDQKEEEGPGSGQESKSELVAKDDNVGADDNQDTDKENKEDKEESKQPNELNEMDMSEYDEDKVDPYQNDKEPEKPPEGMDLPDDLNLDDDLDKEEDTAEGQEETDREDQTSDPMDTGDVPEDKDDNTESQEEQNPEDIPELQEEEKDEGKQDDNTEDGERQEEEGQDNPGFSAQDQDEDGKGEEQSKEPEDQQQGAEVKGQTSHDTQEVEQCDTAHDQAAQSENNEKETEGVGTAQSEIDEGHQGQSSSKVTQRSNIQQQKQLKRKPGRSDVDRSLGSAEQKYKKLKTTDTPATENEDEEPTNTEADLYEHIKDASSKNETQTIDTATADQQMEQPVAEQHGEECKEEDVDMAEEEQEEQDQDIEMKSATKLKNKKDKLQKNGDVEDMEETMSDRMEVPGELTETHTVGRGPTSTIHTQIEHLHLDTRAEVDIEKMREELESQLTSWSNTKKEGQLTEESATEAWNQYEVLTSSLSQELCEQLRLILEPSQATKLKGDYRTGKRLNMRKVIPYIASQFRKDKIWLRRTKPSKRQYQIMLAIDDSSSMVDNHSKQLAFESLAMISNALTLLEAGELAICSFGESVQFVHDFSEQFSNQAGARLLQHFTFEQKKTKIAQLLKHATVKMTDARTRQHRMIGNPDTAQLLLIVSDGRGLFMEGMETVKSAVRQARESNIFLVFVIIDNPQAKDSILDIRVPLFKGPNNIPEIKPYMDHFPFPFYIILRDINSLPQVLCDALRQWFELVTSTDG